MEKPKVLKYKIDFYLKKLPYEDHSRLIKSLPPILNIKESTFFKWKATLVTDSFEIPEGKFQMLCQIFSVRPEEMRSYEISAPTIKKILSKNIK